VQRDIRQAALRRTGTRTALFQWVHPSRRHLQPQTRRPRTRQPHLPLVKLRARQQAAAPARSTSSCAAFLLHLLPRGFMRVRNFGFLANRSRASLLPLCFQLLAGSAFISAQTASPDANHPCSSTAGTVLSAEAPCTLSNDSPQLNSCCVLHPSPTYVPHEPATPASISPLASACTPPCVPSRPWRPQDHRNHHLRLHQDYSYCTFYRCNRLTRTHRSSHTLHPILCNQIENTQAQALESGFL
jgi:hypothetical protein